MPTQAAGKKITEEADHSTKKCPPHKWVSHWVKTEEVLGAEDGVHFVRDHNYLLCVECGKVNSRNEE